MRPRSRWLLQRWRAPARSPAPRTKARRSGWRQNGSTQWHDGLANKGLNFGATYIADNIANVSGGVEARRHPFRPPRSVGRCRSRQARRLDRRPILRQCVRDLRAGTKPQLRHESRHHQRDRGIAGPAALQRLFRAELLQRPPEHQGRPAGRRCRVLRQPDRRPLHQRHVRLARDQGEQPSGRRPGTADRGARYPHQGRADGSRSPRSVRCSTAIRQDLAMQIRSFATIMVWRFASTIRRG